MMKIKIIITIFPVRRFRSQSVRNHVLPELQGTGPVALTTL